eukprot:355086-Chlamydomonas_euryale.AAC.13
MAVPCVGWFDTDQTVPNMSDRRAVRMNHCSSSVGCGMLGRPAQRPFLQAWRAAPIGGAGLLSGPSLQPGVQHRQAGRTCSAALP